MTSTADPRDATLCRREPRCRRELVVWSRMPIGELLDNPRKRCKRCYVLSHKQDRPENRSDCEIRARPKHKIKYIDDHPPTKGNPGFHKDLT